MFKEVSSKLILSEREEKILDFWKKNNIFKKSLGLRKDAKEFVFYEGPPTANGRPGIHHVMSRTVKDVVCRYKSMKGYLVRRKAGWDTHGLPVEIEVEKELNINGKEDIEKFGISEFNHKCKESVFHYKKEWDNLTERIGYWLDLENPYITFTNDYIESVWWLLNQIWKKDLIYQGFKILPYCPRCETPVSSHEVSQGYRDVKDPSIYVRKSVGNNIKDLSKYMPEKMMGLMINWLNKDNIKVHDELATEIGLNKEEKQLIWTMKQAMRWIKDRNPEYHKKLEKILGKNYVLYFDEKRNRLAKPKK